MKLRVWLIYRRLYGTGLPNQAYWGPDIAELDQWGKIPESYNGLVPFTLADDVFKTKIAQKFRIIVEKAYSILGNKLKWVSPVLTSTSEWGNDVSGSNWYQVNDNWVSNNYLTTYSYNSKNISKFQQFVLSKYQNLAGINTAWQTNYSNINEVQLPTTGIAYNNGAGHAEDEHRIAYVGQKGYDFYCFRSNKLFVFAQELKTQLKSVSNDIVFACECGGFSFNLGLLQCTYNINEIESVFDLIKGSSGSYDSCLNPSEGYDISMFAILLKLQMN